MARLAAWMQAVSLRVWWVSWPDALPVVSLSLLGRQALPVSLLLLWQAAWKSRFRGGGGDGGANWRPAVPRTPVAAVPLPEPRLKLPA